jgi:hypothetical protein
MVGVTRSFAAGADDGNVDMVVQVLAAQERGRSAERGHCQGGVFDKVTTAHGECRPGRKAWLGHVDMTTPGLISSQENFA